MQAEFGKEESTELVFVILRHCSATRSLMKKNRKTLDGFNYFISIDNIFDSSRTEVEGIELNFTHIFFNSISDGTSIERPGEGIYRRLSTNVTHDLYPFIVSGSTDQFFLASPECRVYKNKKYSCVLFLGFCFWFCFRNNHQTDNESGI